MTPGNQNAQHTSMDFETVEVMSTLDVTGVSKSLEQAAAKVKELAKVTGAQDVKASALRHSRHS